MSKAEERYLAAQEAFLKAKAGKDEKAYAKAKTDLHKARAAYRANRTKTEGVVVQPATLNAKAGVAKVG